jgi:hypothetical protein
MGTAQCSALWASALVAIAAPRPLYAAPAISWGGEAPECPTREAVIDRLREVFPSLSIEDVPSSDALAVEVWSRGAEYGVVLGAARRELSDPDQRCDERARKVAVVIALGLEPSKREAQPLEHEPRRTLQAELEVGGRADFAPRPELPAEGGVAVRAFFGGRTFGGVLGVAGLSASTLRLDGAAARLERIPIDAGMRGQLAVGRVSFAAELGVLLCFQITDGLLVSPSIRELRLQLGARVGLSVTVRVWERFSAVLGLHTEVLPDPNNLVLSSSRIVGTTPAVWAGASLGVAAHF